MVDLAQFLVGGAAGRPDSLSGLNPDFNTALVNMFAAAPEDVRNQLRITSGFRSPEVQKRLYDEAVQKYGSPEAARKWVAPPGRSQHGHGHAIDLNYANDAAREWAHANAAAHGLAFPLKHENWHLELANARGQGGQPAPAGMPQGTAVAGMPGQPEQQAAAMALIGGGPQGAMPQGGDAMSSLAATFMQDQQRRMAARKAENDEAEARRTALLSGGLGSMYG